MGFGRSMKHLGHSITHTANDVGKAVSGATNDVTHTATDIANDVANTAENIASDVANEIVKETNEAINRVNQYVLEPAKASLASAIVDASKTSNIYSKELEAGAKIAARLATESSEKVLTGLVEIGEYIEAHACNIGLSAALTGAFEAMLLEPAAQVETTAMFAPFSSATVAAMAAGSFKSAATETAAMAIGTTLVVPIFEIQPVKKALGNNGKDTLVDAIAFCLLKAIEKEAPLFTVPQTAAMATAGLVCDMVADLVCSGTLPGGFSVWKGVS